MKKFIIILVCILILPGCVFTGYGVNYDSKNCVSITAKEDGKTFNSVIIVTDENSSSLSAVVERIEKMFKEWTK